MSSEIVRREPAASLPEKMEWARAMASSNLLPRQYQNNPGNLLFAVEYADALGVSRINAITSIHVIEGKPSASADLIASMVRRAGHKLRVSGDDTYALAQLIRVDDPEFTYEARWDVAKARAAGLLGKSVWKAYPAAMLRSRAITEVARMGASDALLGVIYTPEELGAEVDEDGQVVHTVTRVQAPAGPRPSGNERMRDALASAPPIQQQPRETPAETSVAEGEVGSSPTSDPAAAAEPEKMTQPQSRKMGALMREAGLTDREDALAFVGRVIGRQIGSRNELSKAEAARVIDALEQPPAASEEIVDGEVVEENPDEIWRRAVAVGGQHGLSVDNLRIDFAERMGGLLPESATAAELQHYLQLLTEEVAA